MIKTIGKHKVTHSSANVADYKQLLGEDKAFILYTDPPWSDGLCKFFGTRNGSKNITFKQVLETLCTVVDNYVEGFIFIEMGKENIGAVRECMESRLYNIKVVDVKYQSGSKLLPAFILIGGTEPKYDFKYDVSSFMEINLPIECIKRVAKDNAIVLDCFCGQGWTANATMVNGMSFRGVELDINRLNKTITRLEKGIKK